MSVEVYTATLKSSDADEVVLDVNDGDGAEIGTVTISRDVWDELDPDVDTLVIDVTSVDELDDEEQYKTFHDVSNRSVDQGANGKGNAGMSRNDCIQQAEIVQQSDMYGQLERRCADNVGDSALRRWRKPYWENVATGQPHTRKAFCFQDRQH